MATSGQRAFAQKLSKKCFRHCGHFCQNCRWVCYCLVATAVLCWVLWMYRRPFMHTVRFIWRTDYRQCVYHQRQYEIEERTSPLYVTVKHHGRIGNWMFTYASLLGIARANGYIPYLPSTHPLTNIFLLSQIQSREAECLQIVYDDRPCSYNSEFMNLPPGNISIEGYIQSWKYFRLMENRIRKEFTLNHNIRPRAVNDFTRYVGEYVQEGRPVIGIHVRRGDLLSPGARQLGFCPAPNSYIDNAMKYMLRKYPHAVFLVASDDMEWCKVNVIAPKLSDIFDSKDSLQKITNSSTIKTLQDKVPIVFSSAYDSWSDFLLLSMCNHSVITVGTFGWWTAWLANGDVVYYKDFPLAGSKLDYEMNKEDFFPAHWVALSGSSGAFSLHACRNSLCCIHLVFILVWAFTILKNYL